MTFEIPKLLIDITQIAAAIGVTGALIYAGLTYRSSKISEEIKRSYDSFKDLKDLRSSLIENSDQYKDQGAMNEWYERYFNAWEWFSFMVNRKQIRDDQIKRFFRVTVLSDYENIFKKQYTQQQIESDEKFYPEFKRLYKELRKKKYE